MILSLLAALTLSASPAVAPSEAALSRWLVRCGDTPAPTLDASTIDGALRGTSAVPDGWRVEQLPFHLPKEPCWFANRLEPASEAVGLWLGRTRAAWTARLDGAVIWTRGREAPYWSSDQGFPAFIVPPQLLGPDDSRVVLLRAFNPTGGVAVGPFEAIDPRTFPEREASEGALSMTVTGMVSTLLFVMAVVALVTAGLRRSGQVAYFGLGALGFSGIFLLISYEWLPFDNRLLNRQAGTFLFSAFPFFALFFQHLYGIHRRQWITRLVIGQSLAVLLVGTFAPEQVALRLPILGLPIYMGWLVYAVYLNVRAMRAGDEVARVVIWGYGVLATLNAIDIISFAVSPVRGEIRTPVGVLLFVSSILVALARRFFRVSAESRVMLKRMQDTAGDLGGLVVTLQASATQLSSATAEQVTALTETASTTTEMNQTSQVSASRCLELIGKGEAAATVVEEGKEAAGTSRSAIEAISGALASVAGASRELADKVQRIDRIIDTVSFLADQSAALAINASIEASRAGAAGQGFAAVAREVRSLANDSRRATSEVRDVLAEIRARTLQMEAQVSQGSETIQGGVGQVSRMAEVVSSLGGTIHAAVGLMRQVESSARQHQAGVEQVLQAVTNIQRASESIRDGAETLTSLSRKAKELSSGLSV